jgi:hypothetical protein
MLRRPWRAPIVLPILDIQRRPSDGVRTRFESRLTLPGAEQGEEELATSAGVSIPIEVSFSTTTSYSDAFHFSLYNTGSRTCAFSAYFQGGSNSEFGLIMYLWQDDGREGLLVPAAKLMRDRPLD